MPDFNPIPTGLLVPTQIPLDVKEYFATLADMINLGTDNNKAFTYYKGFRAYCVENDKIYIWREALPELGPGLLPENFTYPANTVCYGVDYSGKEYNFFLKPETLDLLSLGNGIHVYKGYNLVDNRHEFLSLKSNTLFISENGNEINIENPAGSRGIPDFIVNKDFIPIYNDFLNYYTNVYLVNGGTPLEVGETFNYIGEGTEAKPFTDTYIFTFGEPNTAPIKLEHTSISNALTFYIGNGTRAVSQYRYRTITIRKSIVNYYTEHDFNIGGLRVNIDEGAFVEYGGLTDFVDMDNSSYFESESSDIIVNLASGSNIRITTTARIKNAGNTNDTDNFATGRIGIFRGDGTIWWNYNGVDAHTKECFSLDANSDINGAIGCNNDGNICLQIECNIRVDFMQIVKQGGKSKIEFKGKQIAFNSLIGANPNPLNRLFQINGGLIRFFDQSLSVLNGSFGGDTIDQVFSFDKVGTFTSQLVMRNVEFIGYAKTWFQRENVGDYAVIDIKVSRSIYFGGIQLFGSVANPNKWSVDFRNNVLESINIDFDVVDFTLGNNISSVNTIGNNLIEQLVTRPWRRDGGSDTMGNLYLPKYSKFINQQGSLVESDWFIDVML